MKYRGLTSISNNEYLASGENERSSSSINRETFSLEIDFLPKDKCTSFYFGTKEISQKLFKCNECTRKKYLSICQFCYENCHTTCHSNSNPMDEKKKNQKKSKEGGGGRRTPSR